MRKRFTCVNGHEWGLPAAGGLVVAAIACPICGAPADTVGSFGPAQPQPTVADEPKGRIAPAASTSLPGTFGRYEIQEELGRGGMGRVYKAFDRELCRVIALKVPHFHPHDSEGLRRFRQEAQAAATFNHPNLCPVFDVGEHNGTPYLTMPFLRGQSLAAILDAARQAGKPLPERQVALVIRKLALALEHAHRKGVVHRDLKPGNIIIQRQEGAQEPLIVDFGLARRQTEDPRLTATGVVMGTPGYMAPEQAAGLTRDTGPAGDIYSLGVILYELLTLRLPFEGAAILYKIVHEPPDPPLRYRPNLNAALQGICLKCLEKSPGNRFASMKELAGALTEWVKALGKGKETVGESIGPAGGMLAELAEGPIPPRRRRGSRVPLWSILLASVVPLLLLAGAIVYIATDYGTVKVELSDPTAEVEVRVDGNVVTLKSAGDTVTLKAGQHEMEVVGDRYRTFTRSFTLKRGAKELVRVTLEPKDVTPKPAAPAPESRTDAAVAPKAATPKPPEWLPLFNGKDLTGWVGKDGRPAAWKVEDGYLEVVPGQGDIRTTETFGDFELRAEFWVPPRVSQNRFRGNSGIFLQGRYEIQVLDSFDNPTRPDGACGALYGLIVPSRNASKPPGQWQSFGITFRSPRVDSRGAVSEKGRLTVVHNGVKVIDNEAFDRVTQMALPDKRQGTPGPIRLQDHGEPVRFRNLKIKPLSAPQSAIPPDAVPFGGHRYKFFAEQLTWKEAKAKCAALGGHLVVIDSEAENRFVAGLVEKAGWLDTWIGITDEASEGDWCTVEGKALTYTNWFVNQPNNKRGVEHYALLSNRTFGRPLDWTWCDQPNESKEHVPGYVCEWDRSR